MANVQLSTLGAVIKSAYEAQADTNVFTDAEKVKLNDLPDPATIATNLFTVETYADAVEAATGSEAKIFLVKASEINDNNPTMYFYVPGFNMFWIASVEL